MTGNAMTITTMARFEALGRGECPDTNGSLMCAAHVGSVRLVRDATPSRTIALSDVFGQIAEALGAREFGAGRTTVVRPICRHRAGRA